MHVPEAEEAESDGGHAAGAEEGEPGSGGDVSGGAAGHASTELPAGAEPAASGAHDEPAGKNDSAASVPASYLGTGRGQRARAGVRAQRAVMC